MTTPINPQPFIRAAISSARFPQNSKIAEDILVAAIALIRDYRRFPTKAYPRTFEETKENLKVTRQNHGISRTAGRKNEELLRFLLFSALFRAWYLGFAVKPRINNKYGKTTPFVGFADPILQYVGIGKTIAHLEEYQSYRKRTIALLDGDFFN